MRWYFDYISPYAYLQSTRLQEFSAHEQVECIPVLFAGLLNYWDNVGPAEVAPKREWTFKNAVWLAHRDNIELTLPAHHPFNPLPLLRLGIALGNEIDVVQRLFRFVWVEGHLPTQTEAFESLLDELNVQSSALNSANIKSALHGNGEDAIERGLFGVPTIERQGELFWGYDATDMAKAHLETGAPDKHQSSWPAAELSAAAALPQGPGRKKKPATSSAPGVKSTSDNAPRIPLKPIDLAEPADLVNAIRKRRGGELIELDRLLLYSTPLATGWNQLLGNVRTSFSVSHKLRELAMCTVAVINRADYEFTHHAPIYIAAGGSEEKTKALHNIDDAAKKVSLYDNEEILTIRLATQMTKNIQVDDQLFKACQQAFSNMELVELVATIAAYNMVSRFLVAFNVIP